MEIKKLLDDCKVKLEIDTDYKLAKKLEMHQGLISDYRAGKRVPDTYACLKIAEVLEVDALPLICHFEALSAKNEVNRSYLRKKLGELGGIAAGIFFIAVTLKVTTAPQEAIAAGFSNHALTHVIHYAKQTMRKLKQLLLFLVHQETRFGMAVAGVG